MRWVLTCLCLLGLAAAPPVGVLAAGDLSAGDVAGGDLSPAARQAAEDAYRAKDYDAALPRLLPFAEAGEAKAQQQVGYISRYTDQDYAQALKWSSKAATQKNPRAIHDIGFLYRIGKGVKQDFQKAAAHYLLGIEAGLAISEAAYADLLFRGLGVQKDLEKAKLFFLRAAKKCEWQAMLGLSDMYAEAKTHDRKQKQLFWSVLADYNGAEHNWLLRWSERYLLSAQTKNRIWDWQQKYCRRHNPKDERKIPYW